LGVFNAQQYALDMHRKGLFEENAFPDLPETGYPYWAQQSLLEEAKKLPNGPEKAALMTEYHRVEKNYGEDRAEQYKMLSQAGTPYENPDDLYTVGEKTPYGIATSDSIYTDPRMRAGSFVNYDNTGAFYSDILDKTSKYYSPEADHIWNLRYPEDYTLPHSSPDRVDYDSPYFSIDPRFSGIETDNRAYWTTPSPEQLSLLNPSGFSWTETDPASFSEGLPGSRGLLSDPIFDIVGGGVIDPGPITETPYG
jgi:hypothetical protein